MMSVPMRAATRKDWRTLGFYYDRDDSSKTWTIVGSHSAIYRFCELLRRYAMDPRHHGLSEHEHYGPYKYLEIMTWSEPRLDRHAIAGTLEDLRRLANLIQSKAGCVSDKERIRIEDEYAVSGDYALEIQLRPEPFDPALEDPECR